MIGGKTQGQQMPTALGTMLQAATYGMAIPTIYGTTRSALLAIWARNLRAGPSSKKGKGKSSQTFVENIDFLIGANPIETPLQLWNNSTKYGLDFLTYTVNAMGVTNVTVPDPNFYKIVAVVAEAKLSTAVSFNCFGSPNVIVFTGGGGTSGTTALAPGVIAASPQFVPAGDVYNGIGPADALEGACTGAEWCFGRIRGGGLSIWLDHPNATMFAPPAAYLPNICLADGSTVDFLTLDVLSAVCNCGGQFPVPGNTVFFGCGLNPAFTMGDGTGQDIGNILALNVAGLIRFDMEAINFTVTNKNGFDLGTPCGWTTGSPIIGPCTNFTNPSFTFPGAGTAPDFADGHNLSDADGGQIFMIRFHPANAVAGVDMCVAVISGARPLQTFGTAPGWILGMQGANMLVFYTYGTAPVATGIPLWNAYQHGPDLIDPNYVRQSNYKWDPNNDGATFETFDMQTANPPGYPSWTWTGNITVYYTAVNASTHHNPPVTANHLTFEPQLGDGPEYTGNLVAEQIIYPPYAGLGSPNIDLGGGVLPSIRVEIKGTFAKIAPRGDAEFADMIEDVIKSGQVQLGAELGLIQRGVNANELPGAIQKNFFQYATDKAMNVPYRSANAAGDFLFAWARTSAATPTIADDAGDAWTAAYNTGNKGFWYTAGGAVGSIPGNTVHFGNALEGYILEMDPGSTALDAGPVAASGTGAGAMTASITVTNAQGPTYILAMYADDSGTILGLPLHWFSLYQRAGGNFSIHTNAAYRIVNGPGTYTLTIPRGGSGNWTLVLVSLKQAQPVPYPKALGKIVDEGTLQNVRDQCIANGLWGSFAMNAQQTAADFLKDMYLCANADPVWSGFVLKSIARSEVPAVANGAIYTPPTCSGPVAILTESDTVSSDQQPTVKVTRKAQVDANNVIKYQFFDRNADYNQSTASVPLSGANTLFGPRQEDPKSVPEIQDPAIANMLLNIQARRYTLLRNVYEFTLKAKWMMLEARDLVTITDHDLNLINVAVRLNKIEEQEDHSLKCTGEDFIYGTNDPLGLAQFSGANTSAPGPGTGPPPGADPGSVNPPIIFEPVPRLIAQQNQGQVWAVLSGGPNYGGSAVYISVDGGTTYNLAGTIQGNAVMGVINNNWPAAADPDTTNDLLANVAESNGTINSIPTNEEDGFMFPVYIGGGLTCIPYELMTYAVANLVGANQYRLMATGGGGNHLRRAVFGAPQPLTGVAHPTNSPFAVLNPNGFGIFKINLDPAWIGQTIFFKFLAFNTQGGNQQALSAATAYPFTPTGCPSNTSSSGVGNNSTAVAVAPGAPGNFTVAHGLGTTPKFAIVQMTSSGRIWFQSALRYDATNLYLTASDAGITGNIICWSVPADAEIALAPSAPGNFNVAHGLGVVPALVFIQMTSGGAIWLQTPDADATNLKLTASDAGLTGFAEVFKPAAQGTKVIFAEIACAPTAPGNFTVPHNLGVVPKLAVIRETSGGDIWFQTVRYDNVNVYLVASDAGVTALLDVWG